MEGLDLETATAPDRDALADLLYEHLVMALPDQNLTVDRHVELGHRFGEPLIHPFLEAVAEHPAILQVLKEPHDRETFGGEFWHADITFIDPPSSVSIPHGIEIPALDGDDSDSPSDSHSPGERAKGDLDQSGVHGSHRGVGAR